MDKLKVWWIPQVPCKPYERLVDSLVVAKVLLESLAEYDRFQFDHHIKPDYCNAGGLMVLESNGQWTDWYSDEGEDIDELTIERCRELDAVGAV